MSSLRRQWKMLIEKWRTGSPEQKWKIVYLVGAKASEVIGVTVYGDLVIHWYSYMPGLFGFIHLTSIFYTLLHYSLEGNYSRGLECTCSIGIVISVSHIDSMIGFIWISKKILHFSKNFMEKLHFGEEIGTKYPNNSKIVWTKFVEKHSEFSF